MKNREYKNSKTVYLGEVPANWSLSKFKYCNDLVMGQSPSSEDYSYEENGFPFLQGNAEFGDINPTPRLWCKEANKIANENDVLISVRAPIGALNIANQTYGIGRGLAALRGKEHLPKYIFYFFSCLTEYLNSLGTGSTFAAISTSDLKNVVIPSLTKSEQANIVSHIELQTSIIDKLIARKQKFIDLLKEKKRALISELVTKGLDANADTKPTKIDWLGGIPKTWNLVPLKQLGKIKYGLGQPPKTKEGGLPLIRATNVERGKIVTKDLIFVDPDDVPFERDPILRENDIIVVRSGAYTADSAIIPKEFDGAITGYDMVIRPEKVNPLFLSFALLSYYLLDNQLFLKRLRAAQPHLNAEELGNSLIVVPPHNEQLKIVEVLKSKTESIDLVLEKVSLSIDLLNEYRQSIVFEAVTGKIDLRGWQLTNHKQYV